MMVVFAGIIPWGCKPHCAYLIPNELQLNYNQPDTIEGKDITFIPILILGEEVDVPSTGSFGNKQCFGLSITSTTKLMYKIETVNITSDTIFNSNTPGTNLSNYFTASYHGSYWGTIDKFIENHNDVFEGKSIGISEKLSVPIPPVEHGMHKFTTTIAFDNGLILTDSVYVNWP
jgi:hypothetical protein